MLPFSARDIVDSSPSKACSFGYAVNLSGPLISSEYFGVVVTSLTTITSDSAVMKSPAPSTGARNVGVVTLVSRSGPSSVSKSAFEMR